LGPSLVGMRLKEPAERRSPVTETGITAVATIKNRSGAVCFSLTMGKIKAPPALNKPVAEDGSPMLLERKQHFQELERTGKIHPIYEANFTPAARAVSNRSWLARISLNCLVPLAAIVPWTS